MLRAEYFPNHKHNQGSVEFSYEKNDVNPKFLDSFEEIAKTGRGVKYSKKSHTLSKKQKIKKSNHKNITKKIM